MSEMFTKCNGFIVSGDPLVYADSATMTGQGTVSEPFGVKTQQLFVQAPLFTGTSGEGSATSGYIGFSGYNETTLWEGTAHPNGLTAVAQLSEPITAFNEYEIHCSFESMYPYKVNKFSMPTDWNSNQPNTDIKFGGICEAVSLKPTENDVVMHAYISIGFGSNFTDLYVLSGCNVDVAKAAGSTATRNNNYGAGLYYVTKVVGINRKQ